ncbi:hypothetical protein D3C87_1322730 [compost metagenome]
MRQPAFQERDAGVKALWPAALESQFGIHLRPACAFLADQRIGRQLHVVEEDFGEMRVARQVFDRSDRDARKREVHDDLRQPLVPVRGGARGPHQRDHVVRAMRIGGPDLAAVQAPSVGRGVGPSTDAGQVRPGSRFAHADAEEGLGPADARQIERFLVRRAVLEDQGRALAVGDPVRGHGRARAQQFLGQHEAGEVAARRAAVFARQGQAQPAALGQLAAEAGVESHPGAGAFVGLQAVQRVRQKGTDLGAQGFVLGGDGGEFKRIYHRVLRCGQGRRCTGAGGHYPGTRRKLSNIIFLISDTHGVSEDSRPVIAQAYHASKN